MPDRVKFVVALNLDEDGDFADQVFVHGFLQATLDQSLVRQDPHVSLYIE